MRRFLWLLCLLPMWAACSCDANGSISAKGMLLGDKLDFEQVFVDTSSEKFLVLKNDGRAVARAWVESAPEGFYLDITKDNPAIIPPAGTFAVPIVFRPDAEKRFDGTLVLATAGVTNDPLKVVLLGEGVPSLVGMPDVLDFGVVAMGESKTLPLPIDSLAGAKIALELELGGADASAFELADTELTLDVGETGAIEVTFTPQRTDPHTARVSVATCTGCKGRVVTLRGAGGNPNLSPQPGKLVFGTVSPGKSQSLDLRLVNNGNMPVTVGSAAFAEDSDPAFVMDLDTVVGTVEADQVKVLQVSFAPAADLVELGDKAGRLVFFDEKGEELFFVALVGKAGGPDVLIEPMALDFGIQPLRVETRRLVTLTNVGNREPARVEEIFVRGAPGRFRVNAPGRSFPLTDEPVVIEVFFKSEDVGDYSDTLVIRTDDDDTREVLIPLFGTAADIPPCDLRINPGQVRFGLVPAGMEHRREISVLNQGVSECAVWDFHMDPTGSRTFRVEGFPEGSVIVGPQEELKLTLIFAPPNSAVNQLLKSAIVFSHSTPEDPPRRIEVSGYPSTYEVEVIPNPIDFGARPIGYTEIRTVTVLNSGSNAVNIARVEVAQPGTPPGQSKFSVVPARVDIVDPVQAIPGPLGAGKRGFLKASHLAWFEGAETAELHIYFNGVEEPLLVPMLGEGRDEECGDLCEKPQAICPPDERVVVNQPHPLPGDGFNAAGDNVTCNWRVANKPFGSREQPNPANNCVTKFTPDFVGDYILEMVVTDEQGKFNTCRTKLTAIPHGGLWVELFWEKASDVDLHLLHPTLDPGVSSNWWNSTYDCYYGQKIQSWDGGGDATASLDRDDTSQTGPENTRINKPVLGHRYAVGVHWFRDAGHARTWATTNIYCGGILIGTDTFNLNQNKEFVLVGTIQNLGEAGCIWSPDGRRWVRN